MSRTSGRPLDARAEVPERYQQVFWSKVQKSAGCWLWTAARAVNGYGVYGLMYPDGHRQQWKAHRLAWSLTNGPIPAGMMVCHTCDNPACCNPGHLFLGTGSDNMQDMFRKGRGRRVGPPRDRFRGERNAKSTVSDAKRTEACRAYLDCEGTQAEIATRYGVTQATLGKWVRSGLWDRVE